MKFRADEERAKGLAQAINYLIPRGISQDDKEEAIEFIKNVERKYGPVVDSYPTWHPLINYNYDKRSPITEPCGDVGYSGVDHTICFAHAFITCPYDGGDKLINSVSKRKNSDHATISAEIIDLKLYSPSATPVLVTCDWSYSLGFNNVIPKRVAIGLMLEDEIAQWVDADLAETWDTMKPYLMGMPHGAKSSLFIDQDTGQCMKSVWNAVINTGLYGPIKS